MTEQTVPDVVLHAALDEVYQQPRTLEPNQVADIAIRAAAPHIRADERRRVAAALDGCLSTLLARGRIDGADRDAIRASIESETT